MDLTIAATHNLLHSSVFPHASIVSVDTAGRTAISSLQATFVALDSAPGDILEILSEMSWDTLFLLVGLAFVAVAVLGNISGKINPGKGGRIAAGLVGACLVVGGFWYHYSIHSFKVTSVNVAPPQSQSGPCPTAVSLQGIVDSAGSGDVIYFFDFSNGNASAPQTAKFTQTDSQIVPGEWQVHDSLHNAWVQLEVIAPTKKRSQRSKLFSVICEPTPAGVVHPSNPAAAPPETHASAVQPNGVQQAPAPLAAGPALPSRDDSIDRVVLDSANPKPGTYLKRGNPIVFHINVSYNLSSADSAILSISTAQLRSSPGGCKGGAGELTDAVEIPIMRGRHTAQLSLTWSGDTGSATRGRVYGSGYLSFSPMFWASNNGSRGARLDFFGTDPSYCYQFGP
jgi:hypothetical protein